MNWLRLIFASTGVLLSLPILFTWQNIFLWKVALAVTEYGHRLALAFVLFGIWSWRRMPDSMIDRAATIISVVAAAILLLPLILALPLAARLEKELAITMDVHPEQSAGFPLRFTRLFFGLEPKASPGQTLLYTDDTSGKRSLTFRPAHSVCPAPCLIVIHGGSWDSGKRDDFPAWSQHWAERGWAVADIDYRLAPEWKWPSQRDDVAAALAFLKANAASLNIRTDCFVILGRSAGAQIATASAYGLKDSSVKGCISLYGPADMIFAAEYSSPTDVLDTPTLLRNYMGGTVESVPEHFRDASAYWLANKDSPPTLIIHGVRDILVWNLQSERLHAALQRTGARSYYLRLPCSVHGFDYAFEGPGAQLMRAACDQFLDHLAR